MQSIFDMGSADPCPKSFNMAAHVLALADNQPEKTALSVIAISQAQNLSYAALKRAVLGVATGLQAMGIQPNDRVLMRLGNTVDFPITYLGCIAAGIVPIPTSSMLTVSEVNNIIAEMTPSAIIHTPELTPNLGADQTGAMTIDLDKLQSFFELPAAEFHLGDPERLAYIVYTSGTSGQPRAVMHAHRAIWARRLMHQGWYDLKDSDRVLHAGAFNWTYTLGAGLLDPWTLGATSLILEPGTNIEAIPELLHQHQATIFAAVPGVYRKIIAQDLPLHLPHLRHGISAGEKLSVALRQSWNDRTGTDIHEAFGLSECSTFISGSPASPAPAQSFGRPQKGRHIAIVSDTGPVPLGSSGQIAVHCDDPGLMLGYYNAPKETAARFHAGWFLTGDLGCMDDSFNVTYLGRADDMMNAGGFRVSPIEVEQALQPCPGLAQIGVIDVEVKADTKVIAAFYTAHKELSSATLEAFAKTTLARYKQPRIYQRLKALPTNPNGKLSRQKLREIYEASNDDAAHQT
ncbi:long-chain fatty acid--CoA ligase [Cognatishimia sp. WU-CL00825]|uniref:class I adenylate-forming enzyme family protein n=1 Tax=Cognatishimia sp. WU-CL00825 TaxID=3127658 RepID=UPI00310A6200